MTGFSKTEMIAEGLKITLEIKSLNGKGLEISFRMPKQIWHKEMEMRDFFRNHISRGTVSVNINIESENNENKFSINEDMAMQCFEALNSMRKQMKFKEVVNMNHVLAFKDSISQHELVYDESQVMKLLRKALQSGLKNLENMKLREGQNIAKDIINRMKKIQEIIGKIEEITHNRIPLERERLRNRIAQIFENDEIDEHRLQMEIVILADKLDVSEECVRLHSHFKFFFDAVKSPETAGRKVNFLLQEINREINTIGSKSNDAMISQYVVSAKEELERVREQVQNVE